MKFFEIVSFKIVVFPKILFRSIEPSLDFLRF